MNYLYHRVPPKMRGNVLYPLNKLKNIQPDLYELEAAKYEGRESVRNQRIPYLDCLWSDVLHLTAVHPRDLQQALKSAGSDLIIRSFFQIDPNILEPDNTVIYLYKHQFLKDKLKESNFARYNPKEIYRYNTIPEETIEYFKEEISAGKRPLLFHRVPHIQYKGTIDTSNLQIVTV